MRWQLFGDRVSVAMDGTESDVALLVDGDEAFWVSPVGQAARARLRGDRFFQIEVDDATLSEYADAPAPCVTGRRARRTCDLLGQIEDLGWHLEHVYWWQVDAPDSPEAEGAQGSKPDTEHVRGVYLFHALQDDDTEGHVTATASGPGHTPTHRRDVS